jgi:hypothetical protein
MGGFAYIVGKGHRQLRFKTGWLSQNRVALGHPCMRQHNQRGLGRVT